MSDYGIMTQPPNGIPSNQYLPPAAQAGQLSPQQNGTSGLPFFLSPDPYGDPNVDRSTVPPEALGGFDQYNSNIFGFNQALNNGLIQSAPQFALNQKSRESLANQIAQLFGSQSQQSGFLNQDYSQGLARLGLQNDQLGVQRNNLGLDRESLGIQRDQLGLNVGANARQPQYLTALHELANQAYNQQAATNTRGVNSSSTARGSFGSEGQHYALSDIQASLANQLGGEAQRYYENMAQVNDQRLGYQNQGRELDVSGKRLDNQNQMLDIQAKSLGIDRDALKTQLERGLERLGLSTSMSVADLTDKLNSSQLQDQILAQQIFNNAIQNSDYYAQFYSPDGTGGSGGGVTNPGMMQGVPGGTR